MTAVLDPPRLQAQSAAHDDGAPVQDARTTRAGCDGHCYALYTLKDDGTRVLFEWWNDRVGAEWWAGLTPNRAILWECVTPPGDAYRVQWVPAYRTDETTVLSDETGRYAVYAKGRVTGRMYLVGVTDTRGEALACAQEDRDDGANASVWVIISNYDDGVPTCGRWPVSFTYLRVPVPEPTPAKPAEPDYRTIASQLTADYNRLHDALTALICTAHGKDDAANSGMTVDELVDAADKARHELARQEEDFQRLKHTIWRAVENIDDALILAHNDLEDIETALD